MIEIADLSVRYDEKDSALNAISLTVPKGTVVAIIGPSGCGKSTLLKVIAGLIKNYEGSALIDGAAIDTKKIKIGFMPQNYGLLPWKTVYDNICLGFKIRGELNKDTKEKVMSLSSELGLQGLENRYPNELSGGQQQRVGLARAFLLNPDILLMDEPFSALDAITREEMQKVFFSLWRQSRVTTMLVTHYVEEALYLGSMIVLMNKNGSIAEIFNNKLFGKDTQGSLEFLEEAAKLRAKIRQVIQNETR